MNKSKKSIQIKRSDIKFTPPKVGFYIDDKFQFFVRNEIEFNNIRIKAVYEGWTGKVTFRFKDEIIKITDNGDLTAWPTDIYGHCAVQLVQLIMARQGATKYKLCTN